MSVYSFSFKDRAGKEHTLQEYAGKVLLIVNTATECGFTPQYDELEKMYRELNGRGFEVLDFPCNQFGGQAPGTSEEIHQFCTLKFKTEFPRFEKIEVNGENALPLYTYLKDKKGYTGFGEGSTADFMRDYLGKNNPGYDKNDDIKWNFTKFLINREGEVVARFEPTIELSVVRAEIEKLL